MSSFREAGSDEPTLFDVLLEGELEHLISLKTRLASHETGEGDEGGDGDEGEVVSSKPAVRYSFSDMAVIRFLRGRKHDENRAFRAMLRHQEWRQELRVASLSEDDVREEIAKRKIVVWGRDKQRRPVVYIFASRHKTSERDLKQMQDFIIVTLETAMKLTRPTEEKLVIVFDLSGFTLQCMDYDVVKLLVSILQYNYPEVLQVALIVNAPILFSACWMVIRPWLDPVTAAKALFIKKSQLHTYIDHSELAPDMRTPEEGSEVLSTQEEVGGRDGRGDKDEGPVS